MKEAMFGCFGHRFIVFQVLMLVDQDNAARRRWRLAPQR
jgi:uncharacterized membrane protein YsdA (DUF1294 family)